MAAAAAAAAPTPPEAPAILDVRALLGKPLQVHVSDGRVIKGIFNCLDAHANILLREAEEISGERRVMGMVLISKRHIVRAEAQRGVAAMMSTLTA